MSKPFAYQERQIVEISDSKKVVYNADEAGLGKSRIAIGVARRLGFRRMLIICPLTAMHSWKRELTKWWPDAPPVTTLRTQKDINALIRPEGVFLVTYGLLSRPGAPVVKAILGSPPMEITAIDEAHAIKNAAANRTKAILVDLRKNLGKILPMSATPTPNHAGELWAILWVLRPDLIPSLKAPGQPMREREFKDRFCEIRMIQIGSRQVETIAGSKNVDELRGMLKGFFIRETKANVLKELPPLRFDVLPVDIDDPERFQTVGQLVADEVDDEELLQFAADRANATLRRELGLAKAPMVADYVSDMLESGVSQVVLWAVHHEVIDDLAKRLAAYGVAKLDGRDNPRTRSAAVEDFLEGRKKIFLGQIQAGGTALTLMGGKLRCCDAVFAETSMAPGDNHQAACRIHRIGQFDGVLVRFASAAGTYDDRIQEILARKTADAARLFEDFSTRFEPSDECTGIPQTDRMNGRRY